MNAYVLTPKGLTLARTLRAKFVVGTGQETTAVSSSTSSPPFSSKSGPPAMRQTTLLGFATLEQTVSLVAPAPLLKQESKQEKDEEGKDLTQPKEENEPNEATLEIKDEEETQYFTEEEYSMDDSIFFSNDDNSDGVVMLMNSQESQSQSQGSRPSDVPQLFEVMKTMGMMVRTKELKVGDFMWIQRTNAQEYVFPVLLKRQRPHELARAVKTGAFEREKLKLLYCKRKFNIHSLIYILEGNLRDSIVHGCACGVCEGVAFCGAPSVREMERVLSETQKAGFNVVKTKDLTQSVDVLGSITAWLKFASESESCDFMVSWLPFIFSCLLPRPTPHPFFLAVSVVVVVMMFSWRILKTLSLTRWSRRCSKTWRVMRTMCQTELSSGLWRGRKIQCRPRPRVTKSPISVPPLPLPLPALSLPRTRRLGELQRAGLTSPSSAARIPRVCPSITPVLPHPPNEGDSRVVLSLLMIHWTRVTLFRRQAS